MAVAKKESTSKELTFQERLLALKAELHVPKDKYNSFGKYNFRSKESILLAIKPLCVKYKMNIYVTDTVKEYTLNGVVSSYVESRAIAECVQFEDKAESTAQAGIEKAGGMAMPQAFGSASAYAGKYALGNLLGIDDTADPDATNTHQKTPSKSTASAKPAPTAAQVKSMTDAVKAGRKEDVIAALGKYTVTAAVRKQILG